MLPFIEVYDAQVKKIGNFGYVHLFFGVILFLRLSGQVAQVLNMPAVR